MEVTVDIDTLLDRIHELFNTYIQSGKEIDLLPLLDKYGKIDRKIYTIEKAMQYIKLYVTSKNITINELEKYNEVSKLDTKVIFMRGKKAMLSLIKSNGDEKELYILAKYFSNEDGKVNSYSVRYVKKCLEYYMINTKNQKLVDIYNTVISLHKDEQTNEFDISLIQKLVSMNDIIDAINLLKNINISNVSLKRLVNTYQVLYPANKKELEYLFNIIDTMQKQNDSKILPNDISNKNKRLENLRKLLEYYLISDEDDISKVPKKYHMSTYSFNEAIKDALVSNDQVLISLIDKYQAKEESIKESNSNIIKSIGNAIINGINYGNGFRRFNLYDYMNMCGSLELDTIKSNIKEYFNEDETIYILSVLKSLDLHNRYQSVDDLKNKIGLFSKNGRNMLESEKELVLDYISSNNLPINNNMFFAISERYFDGDLELIKNKIKI
jgi:hypothetical protein